ncbi:MAG TPA: molybdopterin molybdenumtransferase MoeA [Bacteroidetes bacterium]|nr:molybdopterin molybdenumtransferase MoeA [Bacteroidota bacterium]
MVRVEEALQKITSQEVPLETATYAVFESLGYCLAETIYAPFDLPSFDNSAMDGYAICGSGTTFKLKGEVAAGDTGTYSLNEGEALRIFTGARTPENTTAVIMQEHTRLEANTVCLEKEYHAGQNVRKQGTELAAGQEVFPIGHQLTPASIGLLSSLGFASIKGYRQPRVHILVTGDELVAPGAPLKPGQIYESNGATLAAVLQQFGIKAIAIYAIKDQLEALSQQVVKSLKEADFILISGGISVGEYDFTKKALEQNGVEEVFYKVKQKPGKPLWFGKKANRFVFALPGNPASALTCFYIYAWPLLQKFQGLPATGLTRQKVSITHNYKANPERPEFLKAKIEQEKVTILEGQSSSMIFSMALANALVFTGSLNEMRAGDEVECILIP